jgi:hypothetical protein
MKHSIYIIIESPLFSSPHTSPHLLSPDDLLFKIYSA